MKTETTLSPELLNSERIADRFGNYSITLIKQDSGIRLSNLVTEHDGRLITRTLASVHMLEPITSAQVDPSLLALQKVIRKGGSICATFKQGGWATQKTNLAIEDIQLTDCHGWIKQLMDLDQNHSLVLHTYLLHLSKEDGDKQLSYDYAVFSELHHPDYLNRQQIEQIYGATLDRDSIYQPSVVSTTSALIEAISH